MFVCGGKKMFMSNRIQMGHELQFRTTINLNGEKHMIE